MKIVRNEKIRCLPLFDLRPGECFLSMHGDKNKLFMRTDAENPRFLAIDLETGELIEANMTDGVIRVNAEVVVEQ